jgi:type IV pilus assembly protein PilB
MTFSTKKSYTKGNRPLGSILVDMGVISEEALEKALASNKASGMKTGELLVELGLASDQAVTEAMAEQLSIPLIDLKALHIPEAVTSIVPAEIARNYSVIPISSEERSITLAMANPLDFYAVDDVRFATGLRVEAAIAMKDDILDAISRYYPEPIIEEPSSSSDNKRPSNLVVFSQNTRNAKESTATDLMKISDAPPIVRFTNAILSDAIRLNASDIHIEPRRDAVLIRYRVNGIMREVMNIERKIHSGIVTRIKVLSNMDISIRKAPQDGKFQVQFDKKHIDIRVSTLPTAYGEKLNMRILSSAGAPESLDSIGFGARELQQLKSAISQPQGIVLVTGPTGSGKSTTLYTCLKSLRSPKVNIVTLENPVEYELEGINQVEINPKQGLTFATGLRSILRQDPDIVLLGEIRDAETAEIAFHAAQTGHLVLSTLHANSALETLSRLNDLGLESFNIASSINAIISQRLVRRLCDKCKQPHALDAETLRKLPEDIRNKPSLEFWQPVGCEACDKSGFTGRICIQEILVSTPKLKELMANNAGVAEIGRFAVKAGFVDLTTDGLQKAMQGLTTLDEVFRVAPSLNEDQNEELQKIHQLEETLDAQVSAQTVTAPSPTETNKPAETDLEQESGPHSLLIVDDDDFMRKLEASILSSEGYSVITAVDGLDALEVLKRQIPDMIITDHEMPNMNGVELIRVLRQNPATSTIPTIMLTGVDELDMEVESLNSGADDYLVKPINARKFIARVSRLIKQRT